MTIVPDGIYVNSTLTRWRRVIALQRMGSHEFVIYSVGGNVNRWCRVRTFCRWAAKRITVDADGLIEEVRDERDAALEAG